MDLMNNIPDNNKKVTKIKLWFIIVIVLIILLIISAGGIWIYMQNLAKNQFKFYIDGVKQSSYSENLFLYQDDQVYVSIKDIAPLLGYRVYNGGYREYTEDTTKCYINNSKELVTFESNSTKMYKYNLLESNNNDTQTVNADEPIKSIGTNLYITSESFRKAFNIMFNEDKDTNSISIFTLDYLANYYTRQIKNAVVTRDKNSFPESVLYNNQKALLYNMVIIQDQQTKLYGMANLDDPTNPIIGMRYASIEFIEGSEDFIVRTSGSRSKVGIIGNDGVTKVRLEYDNIRELDKNLGLYLVTSNNKQGIVNKNGKIIVYQDYDQIGLPGDIVDNNVKNRYILYDNCIPVCRNSKWGLLDINGNEILPLEYEGFGCKADTSRDTRYADVLVIPEIEGIVVQKDEITANSRIRKYGVIKPDGSGFINIVIDSIYSLTNQGETTFYALVQNQIIDLVDFVYQQQAVASNQNNNDDNNQDTISNETNNDENNDMRNNADIDDNNNMN